MSVQIELTWELIRDNEVIWNLVKKTLDTTLTVDNRVAANASHAIWQEVIDKAASVEGSQFWTPILPYATIVGTRVPADWPGAMKDIVNAEGEVTGEERKHWYEYTSIFLSADKSEGILTMNGPIHDPVIVDGRMVKGFFKNGCSYDLMQKYIALAGGFLTWKQGVDLIKSWNPSE